MALPPHFIKCGGGDNTTSTTIYYSGSTQARYSTTLHSTKGAVPKDIQATADPPLQHIIICGKRLTLADCRLEKPAKKLGCPLLYSWRTGFSRTGDVKDKRPLDLLKRLKPPRRLIHRIRRLKASHMMRLAKTLRRPERQHCSSRKRQTWRNYEGRIRIPHIRLRPHSIVA